MKILIISDTHDNIPNLEKVRNISNEEIKPEMVIHCGDIVSPFMIDELSGFNSDVHIVFGNNDGDVFNLVRRVEKFKNIKIHGKMGNIEIEGRKLIFVHDPIFAKGMASLNLYDAVFYGHTHEANVEKLGNTLLANPGEVMGLKGKITFGVYDVESNKIDIKEVL